MDLAMIIINAVLNFAVALLAAWLMSLHGQPRFWRCVLGGIEAGALINISGLVWLGYRNVWPGEPIITAGYFVLTVGLMLARRPLVVRRG